MIKLKQIDQDENSTYPKLLKKSWPKKKKLINTKHFPNIAICAEANGPSTAHLINIIEIYIFIYIKKNSNKYIFKQTEE